MEKRLGEAGSVEPLIVDQVQKPENAEGERKSDDGGHERISRCCSGGAPG